jgi:hypothetical protein
MKSKKLAIGVFLTLCIPLLLTSISNIQNMTGYKGLNPVVVFDIGHEQTFNHTHLASALQLIETKFDAEVYINEDNFTLTNLRGADLVIFPAPFINASRDAFSSIEKQAITEYYQDGGSVLYLANPYFFEEEMQIYSSNIRYLNDMMGISIGEGEETYGNLGFSTQQGALLDDFNYLYEDERLILIGNETLDSSHSIITGLSEFDENIDPIEELLVHATFISSDIPSHVVKTPSTTYLLNSDGQVPFGGVREYAVVSVKELTQYESRGLACSSMIMFSDLNITENESLTWFEAYDNSLLWENMISWLLKDLPKPPIAGILPDFGLFVIIIIAVFFVLMVAGSVLFTIGREVKQAEVSEVITKMRDREDRTKKVEKEIEEAYYAEDEVDKEEPEEEEEKEVDMKKISDEIKKKPPKTRSRSERRRQR